MPCQDALHLPQLFEKDLRFPKGRPGCAHASVFCAACEFRVRACSRLLSAGGVAGLQDRREVKLLGNQLCFLQMFLFEGLVIT